MSLAAAVPNIPWTDLAYSLVPNGRTLDYTVDNDYGSRVGVMKQSLSTASTSPGSGAPGYYAGELGPPVDPDADLTGWLARLTAGEPYDADPTAGDRQRDHGAPLELLHRPVGGACADADVERVHG